MGTNPNVPQGSPEPSKKDILNGLFNQALQAMKDAVSARQQLDPSKDLVALDDKAKESFEAPKGLFEKKFDLGEYEITPEDLKAQNVKIEDKHAYLLVGSVDQVAFDKAKKREAKEVERGGAKIKWYQALQQDAELFLQVKDRVETDFPGLTDAAKSAKMMDIIDKMSKMTDFTDAAWAKMIEDNKYTDEEIYGAEGAYNLLLAFQRAVGSVDRNALLNPPEITLEAIIPPYEPVSVKQFARIRLELSGKKGKSDEDRFSRLIGVEVKEAVAPVSDFENTFPNNLKGKEFYKDADGTVRRKGYGGTYEIQTDGSVIYTDQAGKKFILPPDGNVDSKWPEYTASTQSPKLVDPQEVLDRVNAAGKMIPYKNFEEAKRDGDIVDPDGDGKFAPKDGYELVAPDMKTNFAVKEKAKAAPAPGPTVSPDFGKITKMDDDLRQIGIITTTLPNAFGETVYAKYGEKRLEITFVGEKVYNYRMLNLPSGRPAVEGMVVDFATMKAALDAVNVPPVKLVAMKLDLENVLLKNVDDTVVGIKMEGPLGEIDMLDAAGNITKHPVEPNTYKIIVRGYRYEDPKTKAVNDPTDYEFYVTLDETLGYKPMRTTGDVIVVKNSTDADEFMKEAMVEVHGL